MSFVDDWIAKLKDHDRRIRYLEKLDVNPPVLAAVRYSGTPAANEVTYWTGAGTVAGGRTVYINSGGSVGIGTATMAALFHVNGASRFDNTVVVSRDGAAGQITVRSYGTLESTLALYRSNGSLASETAILSGDVVGQILFGGFDTANSNGARIRAVAAADYGSGGDVSDDPTNIEFHTVPDGSSTLALAMTILSDQRIIIGGLSSIGATTLGIQAGTSTNDAAVGGVLYETITQTGNVGVGEDDLATYSVPANTLSANGMALEFEAFGTTSNTGNTIHLRARFGTSGTNLMYDLVTTASSRDWRIWGRIVRTGAATQKSVTSILTDSLTGNDVVTGLNQTLSGAVTLKITGEGVSNNDIVLEEFVVKWTDNNT